MAQFTYKFSPPLYSCGSIIRTMATGTIGAIHAGNPAFSKIWVTCVPSTLTNLNNINSR